MLGNKIETTLFCECSRGAGVPSADELVSDIVDRLPKHGAKPSQQETVGTMLRVALLTMSAIGIISSVRAEDGSLGEPKMLIHGNYCGPGNNAPRLPIDALDAACARYDACTPRGAMPSPACNARLEREAAAIARDPRQPPDLRAMADVVAAGATMLQAANGSGIAPVGMASAPTKPVAIRP